MFLFFITGCSPDTKNEIEDSQTVDVTSDLSDGCEGKDIVSNLSEETVPEESFCVPDFLNGYLDYGTYEQPIRVSNLDNTDEIKLSDQNMLVYPESAVVAVVKNRWGDSSKLLERNEEVTRNFFRLLQNTKMRQEKNARMLKDGEQDTEAAIVAVMASGKYSLIKLRSFKDDFNEIIIEQENASEIMILSANSEELHRKLKEICDLKEGNIQMLADANNIKYLSDTGWVELTDQEISQFISLTDAADVIPNYSAGCPFDLKLIIESNEIQYTSSYATDTCGILIIEDTTYQLKRENRQAVEDLFKNVNWNYR